MLILNEKLRSAMCEHAEQTYPYECCGIITGNLTKKEVLYSYPVANLNKERAHDRFELDPKQFQEIDDLTRKQGLQILGFYHSHPDHPCAPSEFDTQRAWEEYFYIIIAVHSGKTVLVKSWTLNAQGRFEEEPIEGQEI